MNAQALTDRVVSRERIAALDFGLTVLMTAVAETVDAERRRALGRGPILSVSAEPIHTNGAGAQWVRLERDSGDSVAVADLDIVVVLPDHTKRARLHGSGRGTHPGRPQRQSRLRARPEGCRRSHRGPRRGWRYARSGRCGRFPYRTQPRCPRTGTECRGRAVPHRVGDATRPRASRSGELTPRRRRPARVHARTATARRRPGPHADRCRPRRGPCRRCRRRVRRG